MIRLTISSGFFMRTLFIDITMSQFLSPAFSAILSFIGETLIQFVFNIQSFIASSRVGINFVLIVVSNFVFIASG